MILLDKGSIDDAKADTMHSKLCCSPAKLTGDYASTLGGGGSNGLTVSDATDEPRCRYTVTGPEELMNHKVPRNSIHPAAPGEAAAQEQHGEQVQHHGEVDRQILLTIARESGSSISSLLGEQRRRADELPTRKRARSAAVH